MSTTPSAQITLVLERVACGEGAAAAELLPLVYEELRRLAQGQLRGQSPGHTLQATALVHEAYLKMVAHTESGWQSRAHFLAVAATAMRQILMNHARDKRADKRGGGRVRVTLAEGQAAHDIPDFDPLELDDVLTRLAGLDRVQSRVVELRFFSGMSVEEIAHVMDVSPATVKREWRAARAWLNAELNR
ncbi:MAG: sigma-70 family RNA polymerase sigma factor [Planctomycetia bacterium]|nr:MAG: sigma-70 family RNA polymerase sigma factor [Planctomycetia bacterium]